ncbi:MAG: hypothetical protein LC791_04260 [Acidobacteria bacterium]|nr:hypothetical protein [Acidobacteriota bacterium]
MATDTYAPPGDTVAGLQRKGTIAAVIGLVLAGLGFVLAGAHGLDRFFEAYLVAYTFWMGIALGSMALLMVQHLTGGAWGIVIRRPLEAATGTLPFMAALFIPILLGMGHLYHWTDREVVATDEVIRNKEAYLNVPFFIVRQVVYFLIWTTMGTLLRRWSVEHDRTGDPALLSKLGRLSGGGLVVYGLTVTFAMIDWTMSVNPHWFSTIWGLLYIGGQGLSAMAFAIAVLIMLAQVAPLNRVVSSSHLHDLGKLLFAFLMMWAYLSFSQFLIIWSANLKEEVPHYLMRWEGGWQFVSIFIVVGHFMLPYALLLSRDLKRDGRRLRIIATWIVLTRVVEYYWHVAPEFHAEGLSLSLLDVALPILLGGVFVTLYAMHLGGRPLLPLQDPGLPKALAHHVH